MVCVCVCACVFLVKILGAQKEIKVQQATPATMMRVENQQEIFISGPITSKEPVWIRQLAVPKQK